MKIGEAIEAAANRLGWDVLREFRDAPFPCGYPQAAIHPAIPGVRGVMIETAFGMVTPDELRGLIADAIRALDEAEE
jgi:hypothetical protein